ncbi:retrovirus polyprotein, putative [Perkinsus marinus ATCC 50983]|uniref:Retrovirus polyprotein, putative n=1 Tax=Perkinsus marinus (strain ATCC 50983 / TXsc) TaxID=423536 RepID=C5KNQ6_PERM5|nr:retrovirus polyprotein, putative [Perkinsus marinus ATCC 50983]XP_002782092.1 retrovirus polyprotein, putative [Perkinsus marinus ATCC 50983]EER12542.1 retrovirus polyprotein, putative [Perkinsus marinus ATCC 50983]EER13887.1 retrovirus polyprotein, putative [Perkinsus marinus ATCC 50983]|eukprot:XP_002780747.1 retrovirus polyprotein, putative [Perkinsus marinus ATCC 50983]
MKILDCCFLDIVGPLPVSESFSHPFKFIISCMDCCSGYCWFFPTPDITSKTITGILEARLIDQVGVPRVFTVDNARYFTGVYFRAWVASIGATLRCIPVASPHRNALLERQHSGLKKSLKALCAEHPESWPAYVTKAQRRINTRSTYGYSPQELFYGFDALTPFSRRFEDVSNTIDEDSVRFEARRRDRERQRMVNSTLNVMEKMRADALSRISPSTYTRQVARRRLFKVGDSVMKWVRNVDPLTPSWRGPLLVQQVLGDSTYKLSDGTVQDSRNMREYFGKAQNMNPITIAYIQ